MKSNMKTALLTLVMLSTFSFAETAKYRACKNVSGGKFCYSLQVTIPNYSKDWVNYFAFSASFEGFDFQGNSLEEVVQEYVNSQLAEDNSPDNIEMRTNWRLDEGNGYIQLVQEESSNKQRRERFYYIFHKDEPLSDLSSIQSIMRENATKKLAEVLKPHYIQWQLKNTSKSKKEAIKTANEDLSYVDCSWRFEKNHIIFYWYYDEDSNVELKVPVQSLQGVIKPDVLKAAEQWKTL